MGAERLSAVLAIMNERASGKGLQRFIEALAREVSGPVTAAASAFTPALPSAAMMAASVGVARDSNEALGAFVRLSDGGHMPSVGLGTWLTVGQECYDMVTKGLRAGLRHIDTSENYANHDEIGRALADSGVGRSELFLADKLSFATSYSRQGVQTAVAQSLRQLRVEYLDLYMLHSVGPSRSARHEAWAEMAALQAQGKIRHIGVSNFGTAELRELKAAFPESPPVTLQSKFSPYHRGRTSNSAGEDFLTVSSELGVTLTAYCPLNDWPSKLKAVDDHHIAAIAARLNKTPAQVILRWGLQLGMTLLTRSRHEDRLQQATQLYDFELSAADMALISGLAWLVLSPTNRVAPTVVDTYGVANRDEAASAKVPELAMSHPPLDKPIRACDMAWNMLSGAPHSKLEL